MRDPDKPLSLRRLAPLLVLLAGLLLFFALGLHRYVSAEALKTHHASLAAWVADHDVLAPLVFVLVYVLAAAFSIPGGAVLTVIGGFLFGVYAATVIVIFGATLGATALFLAARYAFYEALSRKAGPHLKRFEEGFKENGVWYLLVLRLVPLFPFWLVNIAPAFLGVTLRTYVISTFFGIIPGTFVYALLGDSVGEVLAKGGDIDLKIIFEPQILIAVLALATLALVPIAFKHLRKKKTEFAVSGHDLKG